MSVFEMAKKYYPKLWNEKRIYALYSAGQLTREQYIEIVGEEPDGHDR